MTITRIRPGVWELHTRHGTLIATGDLYTIVTLWARMRRDGWCEIPYGQQRTLDGRPSVECNRLPGLPMPRVHQPRQLHVSRSRQRPRGSLRTQVIAQAGRRFGQPSSPPHRTAGYQADENPAAPSSEQRDEIVLGAAVRRASSSSA
jgi:hypothetical protein